jgi:tagatose 1,6-diphosphate aldolase
MIWSGTRNGEDFWHEQEIGAKAMMTAGKKSGLAAVSTGRGVIAALALDHRGSLVALMKAAMGSEPSTSQVEEFKSIVTRSLSPMASGVLLDHHYGRTAIRIRAKHTGLLLPYENDAYLNTHPEKLPTLISSASVRRLKDAGANCVKVLMHYTPHACAEVNDAKKAFAERIGSECRAEDIPFFLELVHYASPSGPEEAKRPENRPQIVIESLAEFSREQFGVDVLKAEFPVDLKFVQGARSFRGPAIWQRDKALDFYRQAAAATSKPFIYLSAGVGIEDFIESLEFAVESQASFSGVLCGRAAWQDGVGAYARGGAKALEEWLDREGEWNFARVIEILKAAKPCHD